LEDSVVKSVRTSLAIAASAVALAPSIASAHWEYSRWDMTPAQVIATSKGKAAPEPLDYGKSIGLDQHLASADAVVEGQAARVAFYFLNSKTLTKVRLVLKDGAGCDRVEAALVKRYGPKSSSGYYFWIDEAAGNIVEYADDRSYWNTTCRITYSPYKPK
jgi:hypothetical protein